MTSNVSSGGVRREEDNSLLDLSSDCKGVGERRWIRGVGEDNSYERVAGTHTETIQYNRAITVVSLY